jgi:hypothetical protein
MLDLIGIMFSSLMMLIIIVRAVRLDRTQPWFHQGRQEEKPANEKATRKMAPANLSAFWVPDNAP